MWHHRGAFAAGLGAVALGVATGGFGFAVDAVAGSSLLTGLGIGAGGAASALTAANGGYEIANGQYLAGSIDTFLGGLGFLGTGADIAGYLLKNATGVAGAAGELSEALGRFIDVSGGDAGLLACLAGL